MAYYINGNKMLSASINGISGMLKVTINEGSGIAILGRAILNISKLG